MDISEEITDRQQVPEAQDANESLVESLLRLNEFSEQPTQVIADFALQKAIELTRSKTGYLAFLDDSETSATLYSWPDAATEVNASAVAPNAHPLAEGGSWADVVRCRHPMIANGDTPPKPFENTPPETVNELRHMDVPVFDGERIVAVAGVGNKGAPYDDNDIRQVKLLTVGMWQLLQRKQGEDRLRTTAEALRRSEAYLAQAQILTHIGSWVDDGTMRPVYWSEEHYRIFGLDPQQGLPTREQALERIHPDDRDKVKQAFARAVTHIVDSQAEYRLVHPDGTVRFAHSIGHPVLDANGNLVEIVGTTADITERKRTAEALALTSFALNNAHDAAALLDEHGRILYMNDEACRHTGYTRDEMATISVWDVNPEFTAEKWSEHWQTLKTLQSVTFESYHRRKDGQMFPVEISAKYVEYEGTVFNVAIVRDITERKRAEDALRRSEAYLSEAQRLTRTGSWADNGTPVYWSEEHYRIFGFDPRQGLPSRQQVLERIHPDDRAMVHQAFGTVTNAKADCEAHYRIVMSDGTVKYAHGIGHPVLDDDGNVVEMVGTTVDVTERKLAEDARARLHQLETDLAHINRISVMGELTASIAHEVNQPLSGVVSNASACLRWLAGDAPNVEEGREAARRIVRDGKRAAEIIARIRALTKRTQGTREKLDLNGTIMEVLPLVGDESKKRGVTIRTCFADELVPVLGDRVQLQQLVLNLVMNGLEAMDTVTDRPRDLLITSRNIKQGEAEITIQDSGIGLDPEQSARIFDAFYTTKPTGMGMGLSICRSILHAHGGRLWTTPNEGPGTTFHFTLPIKQEEAHATIA
jgi:PAS domain S-box-containing protein